MPTPPAFSSGARLESTDATLLDGQACQPPAGRCRGAQGLRAKHFALRASARWMAWLGAAALTMLTANQRIANIFGETAESWRGFRCKNWDNKTAQ